MNQLEFEKKTYSFQKIMQLAIRNYISFVKSNCLFPFFTPIDSFQLIFR